MLKVFMWLLDLTNILAQYNWTIVLPAELSAAALLINFWITRVNNAVWITIFLLGCVCVLMRQGLR
jgi:amino acid permease